MLIVTGVKGVIFVGRLCWELMYLPFDLADVVLSQPRPETKPANITYYCDGEIKSSRSKDQKCSAA